MIFYPMARAKYARTFPYFKKSNLECALCYLPFTGEMGGVEVCTFSATSDVPISAAFKDTATIK